MDHVWRVLHLIEAVKNNNFEMYINTVKEMTDIFFHLICKTMRAILHTTVFSLQTLTKLILGPKTFSVMVQLVLQTALSHQPDARWTKPWRKPS